MIDATSTTSPTTARWEEARKISAFFRRDLLTSWSYRMSFFSGWASLFIQIALFNFVGKLISPASLPSYGNSHPSYVEFVAVGIVLTSFMSLGLSRVVAAIRQEQLMGTLDSLLLTPTASATLQLGSISYDLVYVPIRTLIFFVAAGVVFDVSFLWAGFGPAMAIVAAFVPFVWGLGVASAAGVLTFKQTSGLIGFVVTALSFSSGAYFPITVLPDWVQTISAWNPVTIALEGVRESLLGGAPWADAGPVILKLLPLSLAALVFGLVMFRLGLDRERRRGTLGLY